MISKFQNFHLKKVLIVKTSNGEKRRAVKLRSLFAFIRVLYKFYLITIRSI